MFLIFETIMRHSCWHRLRFVDATLGEQGLRKWQPRGPSRGGRMIRVSFDKSFQEPAERVDWTGRYPGGIRDLSVGQHSHPADVAQASCRCWQGASRKGMDAGTAWRTGLNWSSRGGSEKGGGGQRLRRLRNVASGDVLKQAREEGWGLCRGRRSTPSRLGSQVAGAWGVSSKRGSPTATSIGIRIIWLVWRSLRCPSLTQNLWE